ncbi:hypothetical protein BKA65DRAFT_281258 [Rhexocercosporidium sp. MPI-PUGE-AT-0058]|nr:hypothetical protein BKA65DRAFT_281258 [Rhexocercosporidium sp. MPI-PUGE-AT-0058]
MIEVDESIFLFNYRWIRETCFFRPFNLQAFSHPLAPSLSKSRTISVLQESMIAPLPGIFLDNTLYTRPSLNDTAPLKTLAVTKKYLITPCRVGNTTNTVLKNAEVGNIQFESPFAMCCVGRRTFAEFVLLLSSFQISTFTFKHCPPFHS